MTCCVFFAVINDAGDYPILSAYRACRDARRRVETGVSPTPEGGGWGASPPHSRVHAQQILRIPATSYSAVKKSPGAIFRERSEPVGRVSGMIRAKPPPMPFAYCRLPCFRCWALCFVEVRRSLGHALNVRSLLRACHALPTAKYTALTHIARTRATDSSHTSHRLLGGVSRRRCPWHTTAAKPL